MRQTEKVMINNIAISFENVSKMYRLGLVGTGTLAQDINRWWRMNILRQEDPYLKIGQTNDRSTRGTSDFVYALKDIDFKIEQGDVVGIIGKNGAGKSTLLKLLSRITAPTTGQIKTRGRLASLLDMVVSPIAWRYDEITTSFPCHIINFCKEYFPTKDVFSYEELGRNFHLLSAPDICNRLFRTSLLREKGLKFNEDIYDPVFSFLINTAECSKRISLCPKHIVRHYCHSPFHHLECEGMVNTYKEFCSSKGIDTGSVKTIESYGFSFLSYVTYHLSKTRPLSEFIRCSNGLGEVMAMFDFSCVPVIPQCVHSMWRFLTSISLVDGDSDKLGDCYCRAYWDDCFSSYNDVWRKPFKVVYTLKQRIYLKLRDSLTRFMRIDLNYLGREVEL